MKAVIVKEAGVLEVQDLPEPEPGPDQIKIKIAYAGICGSDPKVVDRKGGRAPTNGAIGLPPKATPVSAGTKILGHEASGTIVRIGKDVKGNFKVGQRVAVNYRNTCGACYYCTNGMEHFCENVNLYRGLMAEYAISKESIVFPLPDDLPLDVGAFLEPLAVAVHTFDVAHVKTGDSVIITGGGSIGLLALQLAIRSGAAKVLVSEPIAEKRKLAKKLGADVVVDPFNENLVDAANKLTDGRGFNVCIEESGDPDVAKQLILLAARCGTILWAATYPMGLGVEVPIDYMFSRELSIRSVFLAPYSFTRAVQMLPKLDLKPLITVYPLKEAVKAFADYKKGKGVKILLQP
jgi:2-desacetyl-2-hydroxyethyl bacteriochlorophyllide A dehydrogenase